MLHVVLIHPEIPPNTGNIGRLCCAVGAQLHLVRPLGFTLDDKSLKRAGLDYWKHVNPVIWDNLASYVNSVDPDRVVLTSSKQGVPYFKLDYQDGDHVLFGCETQGLPPELFSRFPRRVATIPIDQSKVRSINLATCAGVIVCEALRGMGAFG